MKIGKIKANTPEAQPHVVLEEEETPKRYIRLDRTSTHKYNIRSSTKRVNLVTVFKNAPKMFKMDATEK